MKNITLVIVLFVVGIIVGCTSKNTEIVDISEGSMSSSVELPVSCANMEGAELEMCIINEAKGNKEIELCSLVKDDGRNDICIQYVVTASKDKSDCDKIPSNKKDSCVFSLAVYTKDYNLCSEITTDREKKSICEQMPR